MKCNFTIGQRVVLVNDDWSSWMSLAWREQINSGRMILPVKGNAYTIRDLFIHDVYLDVCLRLNEIINPVMSYNNTPVRHEPGFLHTRFRPLIERKTDIGVFERLLTSKVAA